MDLLAGWGLPLLVVALIGVLALGFAVLIGRWIDAQSNTVVDEPREERRRGRRAGDESKTGTGRKY